MKIKKYYKKPMQVIFFNEKENCYEGGIAYKKEIISEKDGSVYQILKVLNSDYNGTKPIFNYNYWIDLQEKPCSNFIPLC